MTDAPPKTLDPATRRNRRVLLAITLMLAGRAMTLAFLGDVGSGEAGAPPDAWLTPLVGDAVIGVSAVAMLGLLVKGRGLAAWTGLVVWNALGIWDALAAWLVHTSNPWPEFFMVEIFGWTMFVAASAMHGVALGLLTTTATRSQFDLT